MDVLFYQDMLSPHQAATLRALAQRHDCRVTLAIEEERQAARTAFGWERPDAGDVRVVLLRDECHARELVRTASKDAIHVFSGTGAFPLVHAAFLEGCRLGRRLGVLSESPVSAGAGGRLRFFRELGRAWRFRDSIAFFLAIGDLGVEFYKSARYHRTRIFPWGYFVPGGETEQPENHGDTRFRFCFTGLLGKGKGVDILIRAAEALVSSDWSLDVIGDGPLAGEMKLAQERLGRRRVRCFGVLPHKKTLYQIGQADMLILPSRWDGWGAVINEALVQGVRIICTDHCGASVLVHSRAQGYVIPAGSARALLQAMEAALAEGRPSPEARSNLRAWSHRRILPEVAADYLADVLMWREGHTAPEAPWLVSDVRAGAVSIGRPRVSDLSFSATAMADDDRKHG